MPGNRELYEQAMNAGHNAAWDQEWVVAISNYGRAIQEFPDDLEAHLALGFGLLEAGRIEDALKVYSRAHQIVPEDPIPVEKSADTLERLGRLKEAAQQYIVVADLYLQQKDLNKTIANWERATQLTPGLINIHAKLAQAYERIGDKSRTVRQYLILAYNFQRLNDLDKAIKSVQRAQRLDGKNTLVMNTLRALEAGNAIGMPPDDSPAPVQDVPAPRARGRRGNTAPLTPEPDAHPLGPMGEAMIDSMSLLATHVVETGLLDSTGASALQGLEYQRQGMNAEAIDAYRAAEGRLKHPALKMNLGGLLVLEEQAEEAVKHLGDAVNNPQLASGGYHALGLAYRTTGKHRQAVRMLLQAMQMVEGTSSLTDEESIQINTTYERIRGALDRASEETLAASADRFASTLKGKEWKIAVPEMRRQLEETLDVEGEPGMIEILVAAHGDRLTRAMDAISRYMRQGLTTLAMDEAHHAVEFSPLYLPVHERMAEILMREGRVRQAIAKYNTIASVYMARGEKMRAARILTNILEMAPLDLNVRQNLIDLLEQEENLEELVPQYMGLADTYNQLGDSDRARDTYGLAERTAARIGATVAQQVAIKHKVADLEQLRMDFRRSQRIYEEIIQIDPNDEKSYRSLIELHHRAGNQVEATKRLDEVLRIYARDKNVMRIIQVLEELVKQFPNDTGARSRLAAIYKQIGRKQDAITQLDALGELQLEAGLHKQAAETIRQIITMNPANINDYKRLLGQLGG